MPGLYTTYLKILCGITNCTVLGIRFLGGEAPEIAMMGFTTLVSCGKVTT